MDALWFRTEPWGKPVVVLYFHSQRESLPENNPTPIQTRLYRREALIRLSSRQRNRRERNQRESQIGLRRDGAAGGSPEHKKWLYEQLIKRLNTYIHLDQKNKQTKGACEYPCT